jgi:5'-3' exonuclease, N-terminal resolvase-like domain
LTALLIDGDVLVYRAGFATDKTKYLIAAEDCKLEYYDDAKTAKEHSHGLPIWSRKEAEPEDKALMLVDIMIKDIKDHYGQENPTVSVYLSGVGNYRHGIATRATYKGNRSGSPQPCHMRAIRKHLIDRGAVVSAGEEADDLIGIAATADKSAIVVSIDKDLMQLPGRHYDFVKKEEVTVSAKEAVLNFYQQVLSGDSTDNVPGLSGVGPVRARKALADCRSPTDCWRVALNLYTAEFGDVYGPAYAVEAARLVYVRREVNETWEPPNAKAKQAAA